MKNAINNKYFKSFIIYLVIFLLSLAGCYLLFYNGYPHGHDTEYHFANIYDAYYNIKNGNFSPISANLASGVGVGKGLFYSPLPHLVTGLMAVILEPLGISIMTSFKITLFLTYFISGIFSYRLGYRISNNNSLAGLIAAGVFILFPYRGFDAFIRCAYAEVFAFTFLPLFFLGLYDLIHMDEVKPRPFVEIILGAALLFLSHNLTALFAYIFGFMYLIIYIDKLIKPIKNKKYWLYLGTTVVLTVGLCAINLFSQLELMNEGIYNLTIEERMHTSALEVAGRADPYFVYSGFLNIPWLSYAFSFKLNDNMLYLTIFYFIIFTILYLVTDILLRRIKYLDKLHSLISIPIYLLLSLFILKRLEILVAVGIVIIMSLFLESYNENKKMNLEFLKSRAFYYLIIMIIGIILLICYQEPWLHMPGFILKIQFPWRLWTFIALFSAMMLAFIAGRILTNRLGYGLMAMSMALLLVLSHSGLEKRLLLEHPNPEEIDLDTRWEYEINDKWFKEGMSFGASAEYLPANFYYNQINSYQPEYENSLYKDVYREIFYYLGENPNSLDPRILRGNGTIIINEKLAPKLDMNLDLTEDSLIHIPFIYYPGYEIKVENLKTHEKFKLDSKNIDGLLGFELNEGSYNVRISYRGTNLRIIGSVYTYISIGLTIGLIGYDIYYETKKRRIK